MPVKITLRTPGRGVADHGATGDRSRTLSHGTLSIGRGASNDWVLADPERVLSKTHCVLSIEDGRCVLTDLSTNGVFLNGAREGTRRDSRTILTDGDELRIGHHVLEIIECDELELHLEPPRDAAGVPARDALDDLFAEPLSAAGPSIYAAHNIRPSTPIADPFDRADELAARAPDDALDLFRGKAPAEAWSGPSQADDADAPRHAFLMPGRAVPPSASPFDAFDALLGDEPPGTEGDATPASVPASFPEAAAERPRATAPASAPPLPAARLTAAPDGTPAPAPTTPATMATGDSRQTPQAAAEPLLAVFANAAGLRPEELGAQTPEAAMQAAGETFRAMVEGLREVLMSRAAIKNELRVDQTMLRARDNNPLKFAFSAEEAAAALLRPARSGYMAPLPAVREAFADLREHEVALMAAVQTAMLALLKRFDPATLEPRLQASMLDTLLPAARKARIWDLFRATYAELVRESEGDFQALFGRDFARAYDAQLRRL